MKLQATSKDRYRASAAERQRHGGNTVTDFWVEPAGRKPGDADGHPIVVRGYGASPSTRKADALRRAQEALDKRDGVWWQDAHKVQLKGYQRRGESYTGSYILAAGMGLVALLSFYVVIKA